MSFWKKWFGRRRTESPLRPPDSPLSPRGRLRFPKPPFRIDASLLAAAPGERGKYIARVQTWRHELLRALQPRESHERFGLTPWARSSLLHFLRHDWNAMQHAAAQPLAYNVGPFPISAFDRDDEEAVLDLLRWRATVDDYFGDVCDAAPPCPSVEECGAARIFLIPVEGERLCIFCLTAFGTEDLPVDAHRCPILSHVRAKWPPLPFDIGS